MGIFTQNHYNLLKLQSLSVFNSRLASTNQINPTITNSDINVNFQLANTNAIKTFTKPSRICGYTYNSNVFSDSYMVSTFFSTTFGYGDFDISQNIVPNFTFIKFITSDFVENIDTQYFPNLIGYKAVSEQISLQDNGSSVNINYIRDNTTPLYGIQLISSISVYDESISSKYSMKIGTYIHKFDTPITDTLFTIKISYNIVDGGINVN